MGKYCTAGQATDNIEHAQYMMDSQGYKYTNTHTGCVILNTILQQQWLQERAPMLGYMYIACLLLHFNASALRSKWRHKTY